jgi:cell division septal protein FtsQ
MISIINKRKSRQENVLQRGKKKSSGRWLYRLALVLFLATITYALFFADFLNITEIKITGLDKVEEVSISALIDDKLEGKYFNLVKKNNLILFSKNSFKKELLDKVRRIEDVVIEKKFPDQLVVAVKERVFTMLLCVSEKCYILNERGEAYPADNFSQEELEQENLVMLTDLGGAEISAENNPLEDNFWQFIIGLGGRVKEETGIALKKNYETPGRVSGDLVAETEADWKIYFSNEVGMEKELVMLRAVLEHKIEKEQQKNLEYIDLRINNKVFYKFKDGVEQTQETENVPVPEVKKEEKKKKD